jgi:hypothetical protein
MHLVKNLSFSMEIDMLLLLPAYVYMFCKVAPIYACISRVTFSILMMIEESNLEVSLKYF